MLVSLKIDFTYLNIQHKTNTITYLAQSSQKAITHITLPADINLNNYQHQPPNPICLTNTV